MISITERLRTTFSRLVLEWGTSQRYEVSIPVSFRIIDTGRARRMSRFLSGITQDISETGLALLTDTISADGLHAYFSSDMMDKNLLQVLLHVPEGDISLLGQTCRYLSIDRSDYNYLLGVKMINMSAADRARFNKLLLDSKKKL
ncbi:MAG: PilZ domain-containing protein [Acidobacteriota bacterium]|nr:PilZ domain-containing protein [Blastocatellia bacterium]MDW8412450.1 PilZ domain-containing protein [Acidobacteriota bacterium]